MKEIINKFYINAENRSAANDDETTGALRRGFVDAYLDMIEHAATKALYSGDDRGAASECCSGVIG